MSPPKTPLTHYKQTIEAMKEIGSYRKEFEPIVKIYADMLYQYDRTIERLADEDYDPIETTANSKGVTSDKKSPIVQTLESLRKDILTYSDRLLLNPKAISDDKFKTEKGVSQGIEGVMASIMRDFDV